MDPQGNCSNFLPFESLDSPRALSPPVSSRQIDAATDPPPTSAVRAPAAVCTPCARVSARPQRGAVDPCGACTRRALTCCETKTTPRPRVLPSSVRCVGRRMANAGRAAPQTPLPCAPAGRASVGCFFAAVPAATAHVLNADGRPPCTRLCMASVCGCGEVRAIALCRCYGRSARPCLGAAYPAR